MPAPWHIVAAVAAPLACVLCACDERTQKAGHADAERGRRLLAQYQCGTCHTIPGVEAARGQLAVTLESFGRRSYIAGRLPNRDETLARWIVDPPSLVPGTLMPNMGVSHGDARDIVAYLRGLR
jgi:cytochrome c